MPMGAVDIVRRARAGALAAIALLWTGQALAAEPVVRVGSGALQGRMTQEGAVTAFKGVPYARPPVGDLRWKPPQPAPAWDGVRPAVETGAACMQPNAGPRGFYTDVPPRVGEDCLYLNVWAPAGAKDAPVMVFIHGGALITGNGGSPRYDGAKLARKGVVVVTINYRLGVFGFFTHPELSAESPHKVSGNYGTLDQIAALRWVQDNIASFGGDPKRVTLFGQSAGGHSVYLLMASPLASGLFHRAIAMSGYLPATAELRRARLGIPAAEESGLQFARRNGVPTLAGLRAMPAEMLLAAAADNPNTSFGSNTPVVDGWVQPAQLFEIFEAGRQARIPLIGGFTSGEMKSFDAGALPPAPVDRAEYESRVRAGYAGLADEFLSIYPPTDLAGNTLAAARDAYFGWGTERLLQLHRKSGQPAWMYYFDHVYPSAEQRGVGAFHSSDVPFVFGNVGPGALAPKNWPAPPEGARDLAMSAAVMDYWTAFARDGRPEPAGAPAWPAFTEPQGGYLAFHDGRAVPSANLLPGMFSLQDRHMKRLREEGHAWTWGNTGVAPRPAAPAR